MGTNAERLNRRPMPSDQTPFTIVVFSSIGMRVGKSDIACALMNSKNKRLPRFGEIAQHLLDPLPWRKFAERVKRSIAATMSKPAQSANLTQANGTSWVCDRRVRVSTASFVEARIRS